MTRIISLTDLLRYVGGDYHDSSTFDRLRKELADAWRPLHYPAIPPFAAVAERLAKSGCAINARVIVENRLVTILLQRES